MLTHINCFCTANEVWSGSRSNIVPLKFRTIYCTQPICWRIMGWFSIIPSSEVNNTSILPIPRWCCFVVKITYMDEVGGNEPVVWEYILYINAIYMINITRDIIVKIERLKQHRLARCTTVQNFIFHMTSKSSLCPALLPCQKECLTDIYPRVCCCPNTCFNAIQEHARNKLNCKNRTNTVSWADSII